MTVCFDEYLRDYLKLHLKSWPEYERAMRREVLPFIGKTELKTLDKAAIRSVIRRITERGRMVLANRVLQYISKMLKWAVGVGYIDRNPAADIPKAAKERPRERVLNLDEVRAILSACDSLARAQGGFVKFLLLSGQRLNEIAKLTWDEVMDDHITIPRDRNKCGETIITPLLPHLTEIIECCSRLMASLYFLPPMAQNQYRPSRRSSLSFKLRAARAIGHSMILDGAWRLHWQILELNNLQLNVPSITKTTV